MRLQRPIHTDGRVTRIRLRITVQDIPGTATLRLTDLQLQPGEQATGVVPNPREAGTVARGAEYRNGVIAGDMEIVCLSNADRAAPARIEVRNGDGDARIGGYRFGRVQGTARASAEMHTASQGYGLVPTITQRSDLTMRTSTEGRVHLRVAWTNREEGGPVIE